LTKRPSQELSHTTNRKRERGERGPAFRKDLLAEYGRTTGFNKGTHKIRMGERIESQSV